MLADIDAEPALSTQLSAGTAIRRRPVRSWLANLLLVLLITVGGVSGYGWFGNWQAFDKADMPNVDQMLAKLKSHLQTNPEDRGARLLLAQAQQRQGDYADAATNFHIVNQMYAAPNTHLLAAEASARIAAGGDLSGRAGDLYSQLLKLDPTNREALWFLGLRASEAGRDTEAVHYWDRLLQQDLSAKAHAMVLNRRNILVEK